MCPFRSRRGRIKRLFQSFLLNSSLPFDKLYNWLSFFQSPALSALTKLIEQKIILKRNFFLRNMSKISQNFPEAPHFHGSFSSYSRLRGEGGQREKKKEKRRKENIIRNPVNSLDTNETFFVFFSIKSSCDCFQFLL